MNAINPNASGQKNIFRKGGIFFSTKKCPSKPHVFDAIHHKFTTIYHHETPQKLKKPLQNRLSAPPKKYPANPPKTPPVRLGSMRFLPSILLLCTSAAVAQNPPAAGDQSYTLRTQSNIVLVPTTVQTKHGDILYALKQEQFVVEDNGVPQTIHLDQDTDSLGLSLVVVVQCSRSAGYEFPKLNGLGTMIDTIAGDAPREVAIVTYESAPLLLGSFSSSPEAMSRALSQ